MLGCSICSCACQWLLSLFWFWRRWSKLFPCLSVKRYKRSHFLPYQPKVEKLAVVECNCSLYFAGCMLPTYFYARLLRYIWERLNLYTSWPFLLLFEKLIMCRCLWYWLNLSFHRDILQGFKERKILNQRSRKSFESGFEKGFHMRSLGSNAEGF